MSVLQIENLADPVEPCGAVAGNNIEPVKETILAEAIEILDDDITDSEAHPDRSSGQKLQKHKQYLKWGGIQVMNDGECNLKQTQKNLWARFHKVIEFHH